MGSLQKDGNKWLYVVSYYDERGERRQKKKRGFATKKQAEKAMIEVENALNNGTFIEQSKKTYGVFLKEWLENKKHSLKRQTVEGYGFLINKHIIPHLGNVMLSSLKARVIQNFINHLAKELAPSSVIKVYAIISNSLSLAEKWGEVPKNEASLVEKPRLARKEKTVWESDDILHFLDVAKKDRLYIAFLIALTTGLRQGEVLGLNWNDIDFEEGLIHVRRTMEHDGKGFSDTKTASSQRSVYIPDETLEALKSHKVMLEQEKLNVFSLYQENNLVICTSVGTKVIPRNLSRTWYRLLEQAKVPKIRFHDLRHTYATFLLVKQNENMKVVSQQLGHSDIRTTLNIYTHVSSAAQKETAKRFGKILFGDQSV